MVSGSDHSAQSLRLGTASTDREKEGFLDTLYSSIGSGQKTSQKQRLKNQPLEFEDVLLLSRNSDLKNQIVEVTAGMKYSIEKPAKSL